MAKRDDFSEIVSYHSPLEEHIPTIYSPAVTAEMLGLYSPEKYNARYSNLSSSHTGIPQKNIAVEVVITGRTRIPNLRDILPSSDIMNALKIFIPRAFALTKGNGLDSSLIPEGSRIKHLFEEEKDK